MRKVPLGRTGVTVSALCYGTMCFGGDADEAESARLYATCRDAGIDFFDCANIYNSGRSEEILGRLMAHERDELVITTKVGSGESLSRRDIMRGVEDSLRRLATDRIDIYFLHRFDPATHIEDTLRALDDLVRAGKVIYLGASNWAAWQVALALGTQSGQGLARFDVIQPMYNLIKRQAEVEILPFALDQQLAVLPYNPVAGGVLTGKYLQPGSGRGRLDKLAFYAKRYGAEWIDAAVHRFLALAREAGVHPVTLANAWVAHHPGVTVPIIGARSLAQIAPALAAAEYEMDDRLYGELSQIIPSPPPATDRSEERG